MMLKRMSSKRNTGRIKQTERVKRGGWFAATGCLLVAAAMFFLVAGGNPAAADTNTVGNAGAPPAANPPSPGPAGGDAEQYVTVTNSNGETSRASLRVQMDSRSKADDGKFLTTCSVKFNSKSPARMLIVITLGNSIEKAELSPKGGGRVLNVGGPMADPSGQRVGFGAGIENAPGGDYVLHITSTNDEEFQFKWQLK